MKSKSKNSDGIRFYEKQAKKIKSSDAYSLCVLTH